MVTIALMKRGLPVDQLLWRYWLRIYKKTVIWLYISNMFYNMNFCYADKTCMIYLSQYLHGSIFWRGK